MYRHIYIYVCVGICISIYLVNASQVLHNDDGENFLMLLDGYKSATPLAQLEQELWTARRFSIGHAGAPG